MTSDSPVTDSLPILYSYLHCPFCVRVRLALVSENIPVRLREVKLPEKPQSLFDVSPKGTVPVLVLADGTVIDQSLAVLDWVTTQPNRDGTVDAENLAASTLSAEEAASFIEESDAKLAKALIRLKHPERFADEQDSTDWPAAAASFFRRLEHRLSQSSYLGSGHATKLDFAIVPFVSQYHQRKPEVISSGRFPHLEQWIDHQLP